MKNSSERIEFITDYIVSYESKIKAFFANMFYKFMSGNKETKLKNIIIEWNCADLVFETHKTFFKFDNELPDNLDCKASEDKKSSIIVDADYVYYNLLDYNLLIVRSSLEKSKTTRIFDISKFREVIKNIN